VFLEHEADRPRPQPRQRPVGQPRDVLPGHQVGDGSGVGLGLSIVRSVATNHGGEVHGMALPNGGLEIDVTLPPTVREPI
jgi:signal transduction histidine kinase